MFTFRHLQCSLHLQVFMIDIQHVDCANLFIGVMLSTVSPTLSFSREYLMKVQTPDPVMLMPRIR